MKLVSKSMSLFIRLAATAGVMLLSQHAIAAGTDAGTTVTNEATVAYSVGNVSQTPVPSNQVTFVVDNRADFTLANNSGTVTITVGQVDAPVQYTLRNTGNQTQDYRLDPTALGTGDFTMINVTAFVESGANAGYQPAEDTATFVDELEDETEVVVYLVADSPNTGEGDGDTANVNLRAVTADAATPGGGAAGTLGGDTVATVGGDTAGEDIVLAVAGNNGQGDNDTDGDYLVEVVLIDVNKSSTLISDPFNGNVDPYHIPGAVVQFNIDVTNPSATQTATGVQVDDTLTEALITVGATITLTNATLDDVAAASCTADLADADDDGCGVDQATAPQLLEIGDATKNFTISATETLGIQFDTTIQ